MDFYFIISIIFALCLHKEGYWVAIIGGFLWPIGLLVGLYFLIKGVFYD